MIEVATDDSTKDLDIVDALELSQTGINAMRIWFSDLAHRKDLDQYGKQVIVGCQHMATDILAELENLIGTYQGELSSPTAGSRPTQEPEPSGDDGSPSLASLNLCTVCGEDNCKLPVMYDDEGPFHPEPEPAPQQLRGAPCSECGVIWPAPSRSCVNCSQAALRREGKQDRCLPDAGPICEDPEWVKWAPIPVPSPEVPPGKFGISLEPEAGQ